MSRKLKNVIKYVLSLGVAALLMYFCFRGVNWTEFVVSLSGCRWWWVAASILAGVLSNWFRSERWREILLPVDGHFQCGEHRLSRQFRIPAHRGVCPLRRHIQRLEGREGQL